MAILLIFAATALLSAPLADCQSDGMYPTVNVSNGQLLGRWETSRAGKVISSFEGIPFAKPPTRFEPPEPPVNWTGVRDARFPQSPCPQKWSDGKYYDQTEDCLFLNVYTPKNASEPSVSLLPTMVFIHGGAFTSGAGSIFGPRFLLDENVILVTINYRLGALGFLNTGNGIVDGNMGLKDQILALKWVQSNIEAFGGDKNSVTIFGESAGGASVHLLMLSPAAKGLFHKVIAQSGSAQSPCAIHVKPAELAASFATMLGCFGGTSNGAVACLKRRSLRQILDVQKKLADLNINSWSPTIDPKAKDYSVLPDHPKNLLTNYTEVNSANVPLMMGQMENEGLMFSKPMLSQPLILSSINLLWYVMAPKIFQYEQYYRNNKGEMDKVSHAIRKFYFNNRPISKSNARNFTNAISDTWFYLGIKSSALLQARSNNNVYAYNFRYRGNFSFGESEGTNSVEGPTHADELQYLFNLLTEPKILPDIKPGSQDEKVSLDVTKLWTLFAKGRLNDLRQGEGQTWSPLSSQGRSDGAIIWYNIKAKSSGQEPEDLEVLKRWQFLKDTFKGSALEIVV